MAAAGDLQALLREEILFANFHLVNRGVTGRAAKRLQKHPVEPEIAGVAELFNADRHAVVSGGRLGAVSPEQTIPPG